MVLQNSKTMRAASIRCKKKEDVAVAAEKEKTIDPVRTISVHSPCEHPKH